MQDADLVRADLRDALLQGAQLERANLSGARLDGADLRESNLRFTSLAGASLRGADLRGSQLEGTDLRNSDLSGAQLDPGALERSHWHGARGIRPGIISYGGLSYAAKLSTEQGQLPEAEELLSQAIQINPSSVHTWAARGAIRAELGKEKEALKDLNHAKRLHIAAGNTNQAAAISKSIEIIEDGDKRPPANNGAGTVILSGALWALKLLAPSLGAASILF